MLQFNIFGWSLKFQDWGGDEGGKLHTAGGAEGKVLWYSRAGTAHLDWSQSLPCASFSPTAKQEQQQYLQCRMSLESNGWKQKTNLNGIWHGWSCQLVLLVIVIIYINLHKRNSYRQVWELGVRHWKHVCCGLPMLLVSSPGCLPCVEHSHGLHRNRWNYHGMK